MKYCLYIIIPIIIVLLGFIVYLFLSKTKDKNGKTVIKFESVLNKIFHIKFESKHEK